MKRMKFKKVGLFKCFRLIPAIVLVSLGLTLQAVAVEFPQKPITIVINQAAGGGLDLTTRTFAQYLQEELKVPVIVQNITEGGGQKGVQEVFEAKPDGYTLLANLGSRNILTEIVYQARYRILEFTPILSMSKLEQGIIARKEAPFNTLAELKALSQKKPINAGTTGVGSHTHLLLLRMKEEGKIPMENIPFRGSAPALTSLIGGHVDVSFNNLSTAATQIERVKIICTFGPERSEFFRNVPTAVEQGYTISSDDSDGILAPPKLPKEIAKVLETALTKVRNKPEVKERTRKLSRPLSNLSAEGYYKELQDIYKSIGKYKAFFKE